jgi:DNA-binding transcriptional regulator LsrR (DeoR family)
MRTRKVPPALVPASPEQMARAAWLYYAESMTQAQISRLMRISRAKVIGLLAAARDSGLVRIRIDTKSSTQLALERRLVERFSLHEAVVVPAPAHQEDVARVVGHAVGIYLGDHLRDGMSIGVGWGMTLHLSLRAIGDQPLARLSVISLLGGITHSRTLTPATVARRLADAFAADCYQLTAPLVVANPRVARSLWAEPGLDELRDRAQHADLVVASVGDVSAKATLFREGLLTGADLKSLRQAGAVGDLLCHFLDADGHGVDHPLNARMITVGLDDVRRVPRIIVASGGRRKVAALRAAMKAVPVRVLITDETAAVGLLESQPSGR